MSFQKFVFFLFCFFIDRQEKKDHNTYFDQLKPKIKNDRTFVSEKKKHLYHISKKKKKQMKYVSLAKFSDGKKGELL
jgi:hypothetical protein